MLWCRFRRPINPITIITPRTNLYHFYFWGNIDQYYQRFVLPPRHRIYHSAFKRNFSHAFNEIVSGADKMGQKLWIMTSLLLLLVGSV
jgi:hypothetical protein